MIDKVIQGGYCIGCGLCRRVAPSIFDTTLDATGRIQAVRIGQSQNSDVDLICPFSDAGPHENELSAKLFHDAKHLSPDFGAYESLYAGYVEEGNFRAQGSSGGMGSWLATELLRLNLVDVVVSVGKESGSYAFQYSQSLTVDELQKHSKSRYYPVTFGRELEEAFHFERVAIVGLPCFIKGIRRLAEQDSITRAKLIYTVSLVCGHLKTRAFGQLLAWQLGVHPGNLTGIDYRLKLRGRPASRYGLEVQSNTGVVKQAPMEGLIGQNWGHGLLKPEACDYCDDVFGETADISIGDAWLAKYEADSAGTNVVVVRNKKLAEIIGAAEKDGRLKLEPLTAAEVALSQAGGLRHRRDGLSYRLALKQCAGLWAPKKRVIPSSDHLSKKAKDIQDARMRVRDLSHQLFASALQQNDLGVFVDGISPALAVLDRLQRASFRDRLASGKRRAINLAKKMIRTLKG